MSEKTKVQEINHFHQKMLEANSEVPYLHDVYSAYRNARNKGITEIFQDSLLGEKVESSFAADCVEFMDATDGTFEDFLDLVIARINYLRRH